MPVDASIPLSVNSGFDVGKMLSLADMAQQMRIRQTQQQNQNAMSQVLANPQSYDPNGDINQNALRAVTAANPQIGMQMKEDTIQERLRRAQEEHYKTESGKANFDFASGIAGVAYDAYSEAKKTGASEQDAVGAATKARNAAVDASGGMLSDQQSQGIKSSAWDPVQGKAFASMNKEWVAGSRAQSVAEIGIKKEDLADRREDRQEKEAGIRDKQADARLGMMERSLEHREDTPDPKKDAYAAFKREHPNATSKELADFARNEGASGGATELSDRAKQLQSELTIQGVALPQGMRSAKTLNSTLNNLAELHPDKSPEELVSMIRTGQLDMKVDSTEAQKLAVRAASIAPVEKSIVDKGGFLDQAEKAVSDINFSDLKAAGKFENWKKEQTSDPKLSAYKTRVTELRQEYSIVLAKGGLTSDASRAEAEKVVPDIITPKQFGEIKKAITQGIETAKKGVDASIDDVTKPKSYSKGDKFTHPSGAKVEIIG